MQRAMGAALFFLLLLFFSFFFFFFFILPAQAQFSSLVAASADQAASIATATAPSFVRADPGNVTAGAPVTVWGRDFIPGAAGLCKDFAVIYCLLAAPRSMVGDSAGEIRLAA